METSRGQQWILPRAADVNARLVEATGGDPLLAQILAQRGFTSPEAARAFIDPAYYHPASPETLPDLVHAATLLDKAIRAHETILVYGDFDADGQTSTALLLDALAGLGAHAVYTIPDRSLESHGIHIERLQEQIAAQRPDLLITCDTGISDQDAIAYARHAGLTTIITDHHALPDLLPDADAVVNPRRLPSDHALASLPGVGVAYKVIEFLYTMRGQQAVLSPLLDLVALGIVADVAAQTGDTRYLLQMGLRQLQTAPRTGLRALADVAGLAVEALTVTEIAFDLAPRLNAAGRLADAALGIELLTTNDLPRARVLAAQVDGLNRQRRALQNGIYSDARRQLDADPTLLDRPALLIGSDNWHPGVIGAAAGQLAESTQRPVFLFTSGKDGLLRGSARSTPKYDIHAALIATQELLVRFGGHAEAAGFTLHAEDLDAFRETLFAALAVMQPSKDLPALPIDATVSLRELTPAFAERIRRLAPFGEANPPVTFLVIGLVLKSAAFIDRAKQHRRLTVQDPSGLRQSLIWWRGGEGPLPDSVFDAAIQIDLRARQATADLQLTLVDFRRAASAPPEVISPRREIIDCRNTPDPVRALTDLLEHYPGASTWAEGYRRDESPGSPLRQLDESHTLIVYTTPPGSQQLHEAWAQVQPELVILLGVDPPLQNLTDLQRRMLELCKYVILRQNGQTTLSDLAGALAQTPAAARALLDLSAAQGELDVSYR